MDTTQLDPTTPGAKAQLPMQVFLAASSYYTSLFPSAALLETLLPLGFGF